MREYKASIREAEFLLMSPECILTALQKLSTQGGGEHLNEKTEESLMQRREPLIDLALAQYSRNLDVVIKLYRSAEQSSPICLACLANPYVGKQFTFFRSFPIALLDSDASMAKWLNSASDNEIVALFENPSLSDNFLSAVLKREGDWEHIESERLAGIAYVLSGNPRMHTPRDDGFMDLHAEVSYDEVFDAAWRLAQTAPVTPRWALALGHLYERLHPRSFIESPLDMASRWIVNPSDAEELRDEYNSNSLGYLGNFQRVRKGIARLALERKTMDLQNLDKHSDIAFRSAFWSAGFPSISDIWDACRIDGVLAFNQFTSNLRIWRHSNLRKALHEAAWSISRADKRASLDAPNAYNAIEERHRKDHPAWFAEENADATRKSSDETQKLATKADVDELVELLERHAGGVQAEIKTLTSKISTLEQKFQQQASLVSSMGDALEGVLSQRSLIRALIVLGFLTTLGFFVFSR